MAFYTANDVQTVAPGADVIFTASNMPCQRGLVRHSDGTGDFMLSGWTGRRNGCGCNCGCNNDDCAEYLVSFGGNIAVADGGTAGEISLAIVKNGTVVPASTMTSTPADIGEYNNVGVTIPVCVWAGCCQSVAIRNTGTEPIDVINASIYITRPDLLVSR